MAQKLSHKRIYQLGHKILEKSVGAFAIILYDQSNQRDI